MIKCTVVGQKDDPSFEGVKILLGMNGDIRGAEISALVHQLIQSFASGGDNEESPKWKQDLVYMKILNGVLRLHSAKDNTIQMIYKPSESEEE